MTGKIIRKVFRLEVEEEQQYGDPRLSVNARWRTLENRVCYPASDHFMVKTIVRGSAHSDHEVPLHITVYCR
jgi:hypothetical protein